jgi:hypothetical protein
MGKHTPGPWEAFEGGRFGKDVVITSQSRIDNSKGSICEMDIYFDGEHGEQQEANAHLIAAAPDLLEALESALKQMEHDIVKIDSEWGACRNLEQMIQEIPSEEDVKTILKARTAIAKAKGESN